MKLFPSKILAMKASTYAKLNKIFHKSIFLITLQGSPNAMELSGMSRTTTLPAPMTTVPSDVKNTLPIMKPITVGIIPKTIKGISTPNTYCSL